MYYEDTGILSAPGGFFAAGRFLLEQAIFFFHPLLNGRPPCRSLPDVAGRCAPRAILSIFRKTPHRGGPR